MYGPRLSAVDNCRALQHRYKWRFQYRAAGVAEAVVEVKAPL